MRSGTLQMQLKSRKLRAVPLFCSPVRAKQQHPVSWQTDRNLHTQAQRAIKLLLVFGLLLLWHLSLHFALLAFFLSYLTYCWLYFCIPSTDITHTITFTTAVEKRLPWMTQRWNEGSKKTERAEKGKAEWDIIGSRWGMATGTRVRGESFKEKMGNEV